MTTRSMQEEEGIVSDCITMTITINDGTPFGREVEVDVQYELSLGYAGSFDEEPMEPEIEVLTVMDFEEDIITEVSDETMREIKLNIVTEALHHANEEYLTARGQRAMGNVVRRLQGLHDDIETMIRREANRADQ